MRVELFNYGRYRYMLCGVGDLSPGERYETELDAFEAGAKLFADRNERHWANQPEVVARIRTFPKASVPWHLSGLWEDNSRKVVTCLCRCVLDGSVVILQAEPAYIAHSGFVPARRYAEDQDGDLAQRIKAYAERFAAHAADFANYTQVIDERAQASKLALTPLRHIETIAEAGARNLAARAALTLLAVASALPARRQAHELGEVTSIGSASTPLGDAEPFEFGDTPGFGDSFDIAKTPNRGEPGTWYTNAGSGQMRLYGDTGAPVVDFDFDHDHGQGTPHAHNYGPPGPLGEFNRETGRSFSLLPW
jgi:hypothetical protein